MNVQGVEARVMKIARFAPLAIAALALALASYAMMRGKPAAPDPMLGKTPAAMTLTALTPEGAGAAIPFSPKGPAIINFWASWCTPCRAEHPYVMELSRSAQVPIIGVAYRDPPSGAADYLKELGDPYAQAFLDPDGQAAINYGLKGVPETFVIGANGEILVRFAGPLSPESIRDVVMPALSRAKTTTSR